MYYSGKLQNSGKQFDSCTSGKPFRFRLGKQEVIKGWDSGLIGMINTLSNDRRHSSQTSLHV